LPSTVCDEFDFLLFYLPSLQGSPVLDGLLQSHLRCGQSTASSSCQASFLCYASTRLSSYGRRTFAVWNSLSDDLRDPTLSTNSFRVCLKLGRFQSTYMQRIGDIAIALYALYKFTTY